MSTLGTARAQLADELGQDEVGGHKTAMTLAVIKAIETLEYRHFPWNVAELSIAPLVIGVADSDTGRKYIPRALVNLNAAPAVDKGGGKVGLPATAHGFLAAVSITVAGTTNYNGTYTVDTTTTANEIVITATFVSETFTGAETVDSSSDLPSDFLQPRDRLWVKPDTTQDKPDREWMIACGPDEYQVRRAENGEENGTPLYYTLIGDNLWITPAADATTMEIFGTYTKRLPTPTKTSADSFASDWFVAGKGLTLVVEQAAKLIRRSYYDQQSKAAGSEANATEVLASNVITTARREHANRVVPYVFGDQ